MRSSPWYHQRRSESAPPAQRPREPPSISQKEQEEVTARISRPTESALYRKSLYWKLDSFMERGFHSWSKMDLFGDCKRCMWTQDGTVKPSCKIRPLNTSASLSLPPLAISARRSKTKIDKPPRTGRSTSRGGDGACTSRSVAGVENGACGTARVGVSQEGKRPAALSNGLAMLGNVSGARYRLQNKPTLGDIAGGGQSKCQYPVAAVKSMAVPKVAHVAAF